MKHYIEGVVPNTEITITELEGNTCIITILEDGACCDIELDFKRLYSFIGTALHVQQKIKDR